MDQVLMEIQNNVWGLDNISMVSAGFIEMVINQSV